MNEEADLEASGVDGNLPACSASASKIGRLGKGGASHAKMNAQKESFWQEKPHLPCSKQLQAHIAIIATKSGYFQQIFHEKIAQKTRKDETLVIDFNGQVQYEAFRKIVDYLYLNDLSMLELIQDSSEILEIIKLSKLYKLENLFKAAENYFQEIMFLWFENHSVFSLKPNIIASITGQSSSAKRSTLMSKNKPEGENAVASTSSGAQNVAMLQTSSLRGDHASATNHTAAASNAQMNKYDSLRTRTGQVSHQSQIMQSAAGQIVANKRRRVNMRLKNMLQGMMFLPDGRVLIMDNELFRRTIEQSIVLDLLDQDASSSSSSAMLDVIQHQLHSASQRASAVSSGHESVEEEKQSSNGGALRYYKDSNRKQSQANQKKRQPGDDQVNMSQQIDSTMLNNQSMTGGPLGQGGDHDQPMTRDANETVLATF